MDYFDYADAADVFVSCLPPSICLIDSVGAIRISAGIEPIYTKLVTDFLCPMRKDKLGH